MQAYVSPDGTAVFSTSFHIIKESSSFVRLPLERPLGGGNKQRKGGGLGDGYQGKFTWKIENFTKLKDLLKKRKITSLCIKSRRFQVRLPARLLCKPVMRAGPRPGGAGARDAQAQGIL